MSCSLLDNLYENSLHYSSPGHGGWGVLKIAQLIPESHFLFVSPAACGRHGALGARMEGRKERVSYLFLTEQSIVSGDYEDMLKNALADLLEFLKKRKRMPKVMGIFVSCIDDLLGTDHFALIDELSGKYPDIKFVDCHMNPTSTDTGVPPLVNVQNKIYSVLERQLDKDTGINIIGNLEAIHKDSELFDVLKEMGACAVRHISDYRSQSDYQEMAKSRLNLVIAPSAEYAAKNMKRVLQIPYEKAFVSYRVENIRENYLKMAAALNEKCPDLSEYEAEAKRVLSDTKEYLSGTSLVLDEEATLRVFEFARCLLESGFSVRRIYSQQVIPSDKENFEWVMENYPEIEICQPLNPKSTLNEKVGEDCIAIGYSAGYLSGAKHVVDISGQNGFYGYKGLIEMMNRIRSVKDEVTDLKKIIEEAVIIV